jgi:neopullulanase
MTGINEQANPAVNPAVDPAFQSKVEAKTPDWVKDAVFYQIFPERFAQSPAVTKPSNLEPWDSPPTPEGFKGGDLLGIAEKIDYLADLGITAIYLNPIFASAANHRYHTFDYFQVDPILGGNTALRKLLDVAHTRGIRVVLDGVFNHASRGFFQFNHTLENGPASPYIDWFHFREFPLNPYGPGKANYDAWIDLPALPKFNTNTKAVREYLWSVGRYWLEFGIDGWRLDVPNEIDDDDFWREFRRQVKEVNPEAYICGEIWGEAQRWLQGDQFDSVMNYLFTEACFSFFIRDLDYATFEGTPYSRVVVNQDAASFGEAVQKLLNLYPAEITAAQLNLLDSHDTARFVNTARGDETALRLATLFQMCFPGAPCVYYGDEIGLAGGRDPDCRRAFPWDPSKWNTLQLSFFKKVIEIRKEHPALRRGAFEQLHARDKLYVFGRSAPNEKLVIALNAGEQPATIPAQPANPFLPEGSLLIDLIYEGEESRAYRVGPDGTIEGLELAPRSGVVLEVIRLAS